MLTAPGPPEAISKFARRWASISRAGSGSDCLIEVGLGPGPTPTLIGARQAAGLARTIGDRVPGALTAVRGGLCLVVIDSEDWLARCRELLGLIPDRSRTSIALPGELYGRDLTLLPDLGPEVEVSFAPGSGDRDVLDLARGEAVDSGLRPVATRGEPGSPRSDSWRLGSLRGRLRAIRRAGAAEGGQATLLTLSACFGVMATAAVLLSVAGAVTGKGRAQTVADLTALSAARSMRDDLPRLLAPPTFPNGLPNPAHMPRPVYLARAAATARRVAASNGASALTVSVVFPDAVSPVPLRTRVAVPVRLEGRPGRGSGGRVRAEARVGMALPVSGFLTMASGGGYSGPLVVRQGHGMRPDVAAAFDQMSAAAASSGVMLVINSGFRSDAEQARLFRANPDPRWVAPPGQSLHRCATELDIGPPSSYGWLAANAGRFGFTKRYSWEPWHYGFVAGPAPCSPAGERVAGSPRGSGRRSSALPGWVPGRYRAAILRASLASGVPAILLAAQLKAESNFDPGVVSSAGALGIAQFMPATAASYGLRDPFDPFASIAAQARMMAELLARFGSPTLALAAYNAGPGAVGSCDCIPPYPETQAYVARILALVGDPDLLTPSGLEVELVG